MKQKRINQLIYACLIVLAILGGWQARDQPRDSSEQAGSIVLDRDIGIGASANSSAQDGEAAVIDAFNRKISDLQVRVSGRVKAVLRDDTKGSRHQRFILQLPSGHTLLVAHNIDLAPRVPGLAKGDRLTIFGEYEWTEQGGVVHWTHKDPSGRHISGWLEFQGQRYQ